MKINLNYDNGNRMERKMTEERLLRHLLPIEWVCVCVGGWVSVQEEGVAR